MAPPPAGTDLIFLSPANFKPRHRPGLFCTRLGGIIDRADVAVVVDLFDRARRIVSTGSSERFIRIEIELFSGRSIEAKRDLYRSIVEKLAGLGVPELETKISLIEVPMQNWGLRAGLPASEIVTSFKVNV